MKRNLTLGMFIIILLIISGCTNKELDTLNKEKEILTNEILHLKKLLAEKDEKISHLEKVNANIKEELSELTGLGMNRFSFYSRLDDVKNSFDHLKGIYEIDSKYEIEDDWYVINDDYFHIELLKYENAKKVDFYLLRLESDEALKLVFTDTDSTDGWKYSTDSISTLINKHQPLPGGFTYEPYFIIYTEVTLQDGHVTRTPKLPIYNK